MDWKEDIGSLLTGFSEGYSTTRAKREEEKAKWQNELRKAIMLEQVKSMYSQPKKWEPTTKEEYYEARERDAMLKPPKSPKYQTVGGKIIAFPAEGGEGTLAYEDPEKIKAKQGATENVIRNAQDMLTSVKKVRELKDFFGPAGDVGSHLVTGFGYGAPEKYAKRTQWEAEVQKIMAQRMIEKMIELKNASRTGSTGFGQLTEREGRKIQEAATALNRGLTPDVADYYLQIMENSLNTIVEAAQKEGVVGAEPSATGPVARDINTMHSSGTNASTNKPSVVEMKKARARQIRARYPNLSTQEIVKMVNKEF